MTRFSIHVDNTSNSHTNFRLFVNGALSGKLCMQNDEFTSFAKLLDFVDGLSPLSKIQLIPKKEFKMEEEYDSN